MTYRFILLSWLLMGAIAFVTAAPIDKHSNRYPSCLEIIGKVRKFKMTTVLVDPEFNPAAGKDMRPGLNRLYEFVINDDLEPDPSKGRDYAHFTAIEFLQGTSSQTVTATVDGHVSGQEIYFLETDPTRVDTAETLLGYCTASGVHAVIETKDRGGPVKYRHIWTAEITARR
jgi:hypothetical protein